MLEIKDNDKCTISFHLLIWREREYTEEKKNENKHITALKSPYFAILK